MKIYKMTLLRSLTVAAAVSFWIITAGPARAATFDGKLWIVAENDTGEVTFPAPAQTPDATFQTDHLSFFSNAPCPGSACPPLAAPFLNNPVAGFLNSAQAVSNLTFSNLINPVLGHPVSSATPTVNSSPVAHATYATVIEFTGTVALVHNEELIIAHDDGISLEIDGRHVISTLGGFPRIIGFQFKGTTGSHTIDLLYTNVNGPGLLSVSPAM